MPTDAAPALHVKHVALARMYGVAQHDLAAADLAAGINIIYGPNAAGKTTLARGLEALLWPESPLIIPHRPTGHGEFAAGAHTYRVELDAGRARYQRDGVDRDRPDLLPPAHTRHRYHLYLHELLQAIDGPDAFADAIHRQVAGGYDIAAAATSLGFEQASGRVVMNLLWMAALTAFCLIEKIAPAGDQVGRVAGALFIGWGLWLMVGGML